MKANKLFRTLSKSLFSKLALVAILLTGGGNSVWAQKSLPYSYGFENNNLASEGWITSNIYSGFTGIINSIMNTGDYCFRFSASSDNTPQYLISPELASSETGIDVSFYYRSLGVSYTTKFFVGYSTTGTDISDFIWSDEVSYAGSSYTSCSYSFATGTKYIAIKYTATDKYCHLYIDDFSVSAINPYKVPTAFTLETFTENSATFSWTAGNSETAWQLRYSTSSDFAPENNEGTLIDNITSNPYTISGLTTGTTYYATIRANYGEGNYSEWTDRVEFTPSDESELTINEGTSARGYAPIYGSYTNSLTRTQLIIPSSSLTSIRNRQITKLTFYTPTSTTAYKDLNWGVATFEVYIKPISNSSFSSETLESWGTKVYNSATVSVSDYKMVITLNTPFNYSDGNLMIGFKQTTVGSSKYAQWIGVDGSTNRLLFGYGENSNNKTNFNPQITFTTTKVSTVPVQLGDNGYTTFSSSWPLDLSDLPSGLKAYKAAVNGEKVRFTEINQAVPANTGILLKGTSGETYEIPVADLGTAPEGNEFLVNTTGETFTAADGYTYFAMKKNSDPLTFGVFSPNTVAIPANKAYLKVSDAAARQLICVFEDSEATGISEASHLYRNEGRNEKLVFNLNGQRVDKPTKGLYVVDGRKVVVK